MHYTRPVLAAAAFGLFAALPALAASGDVSSIGMRDFNHDGRIDRAIVRIANPSGTVWQVRGNAGIGISYQGQPLKIRTAFMAGTADPAALEIVLEDDGHLPATTSAEGFEVTYAPQGAASGVSDGTTELSAIAAGDTGASDTELDEAGPVLLASSPAASAYDTLRDADLSLTFSEPVVTDGIVISSAQNPDSWGTSVSGNVLTVTHAPYGRGVTEVFGVDAADAAGNRTVVGPYPNPFSFRTSTANVPTPAIDTIFTLTSPVSLQTLQAGEPNVLAWYTNDAGVSAVRLSYSTDGGVSYLPIAERPVSDGTYVWYPPAMSGSIQLRAYALGSTGAVLNASIVSPVSVSGAATAPLRVVSGPTIVKLSDSSVMATVDLDRPPASAAAACSSISAPVEMTGDRPTRLEATVAGLPDGFATTCRFTVTDFDGTVSVIETASITAGKDVMPPALVGPAAVDMFNVDARTARVSWTTDEPSTSEVRYGVYLNFSGTATDDQLSTSHSLTLTNLTPGVLHQLRITSVDAQGNAAATPDVYFVFLREGDLIKAKDNAAVYWYKGGKRWVFPNENTYRSWFGDDFSKVITVPASQLGTIMIGGDVKMKAGVYLLKIQSDPKTYAVEPDGLLRWIRTEDQARELYGLAWNKRVRDVDVSLWVDYTIGQPLQDGEKPAGYAG
jgi:hypothetical protein